DSTPARSHELRLAAGAGGPDRIVGTRPDSAEAEANIGQVADLVTADTSRLGRMPKNGRQSTAPRPQHRRTSARSPGALAPNGRAEQARGQSEDGRAAELESEHLAAIVRSAAVAISGMSTDGVIETWNDAATRLYGHTAAEASGQTSWMLLSRNPAAHRERVARASAGEEVEQFDSEDLRKDGSGLDVSLTLSPIRDPQGTVIGVSRIARDITLRKTMERELRYLAEHDWLTGLYNRRRLMAELERCLAYTRRYGRSGAVLVIDV